MNNLMGARLSFDGKGINDLSRDYGPRIATFRDQEEAERFGPLFEASMEMLRVCKEIVLTVDGLEMSAELWESLHKVIAIVEGGA